MTFLRDAIQVLSGYRKFTIMFLLIVLGGGFRLASIYTLKKYQIELVSGSEMVDLIKFSAVAFFAGNGLEHMTNAIKDWAKIKYKQIKNK